jgi:hypothetical protein
MTQRALRVRRAARTVQQRRDGVSVRHADVEDRLTREPRA